MYNNFLFNFRKTKMAEPDSYLQYERFKRDLGRPKAASIQSGRSQELNNPLERIANI